LIDAALAIATWLLAVLMAVVGMPNVSRTDQLKFVQVQQELLTRRAEQSLASFYRQSWRLTQGQTPRIDNWHIDAICDHLQAVTNEQIRKLVINVPPRHSKSTTTCTAWPAWVWGPRNLPQKRWIFTSFKLSLARRDSVHCRRIIESRWYRDRWGERFVLTGDQNAKDKYENDKAGVRMIGSFKGGVTGEGANVFVVDDPVDASKAETPGELERVIDVWESSFTSRLNDPEKDAFVIIMQRVAENDLCGHVLKQAGWEHLRLPAEYELDNPCRTFITVSGAKQPFFEDPRTDDGELLNPARFNKAALDEQRTNEYTYAAQQQQRPAPRGGLIFEDRWWRFYDEKPREADGDPRRPDHGAQSWDLAFKDLKTSDFIACLVGELYGADIYLTDYVMKRASFTASCDEIRQMQSKHPHLDAILVEDKANGPAVADALAQEISGIVLVNPEGGKISRAYAAQPTLKSGNVYLPNPNDPQTGRAIPERTWVKAFIKNCGTFPKGTHDDDVDAFTQLVRYLRGTHSSMLEYLKTLKARDDAQRAQAEGQA
jgi:predicted phage terminase large subunit-like protein